MSGLSALVVSVASLATNYADICRDVEVPQDDRCLEVWEKLVEILVDTLGVEPEKVTFRSRMVQDLGMD